MMKHLKMLIRDDEAATAVEYAILLGGVAAIIVAAVGLLGGSLKGIFENIGPQVTTGS